VHLTASILASPNVGSYSKVGQIHGMWLDVAGHSYGNVADSTTLAPGRTIRYGFLLDQETDSYGFRPPSACACQG
jgi:hypothetical protein